MTVPRTYIPTLEQHMQLVSAAQSVVDTVTHDESGTNGQGGNGGLISRDTIRAVNELRAVILSLGVPAA